MLENKILSISRESEYENDRIRRENEEIKQTLNQKMSTIEKEYIKISRHEEILNSEVGKQNEKISE